MRAETLSAFERHLIAASMRPKTIATYLRIVGLFGSVIAPRSLVEGTSADVETFLARARRSGAPAATATRNLELIALRRLFRSLGGADPAAGFQLKRPERRDPAVPTSQQLRAIFEAAAIESRPVRSLAIIVLLFQAGLRVHELALDVEQVDLASGTIVAASGKGGVRTDMPLGPEAVALLAEWIAVHPTGDGPLFPSSDGAGNRCHLSVRAIERLVARLRAQAGITKQITPHSLRHAAATQAIIRGVDLPSVAALLRHRRIETTMGYVALASDARREASTRIGAAIPRSVLPVARNPPEDPPRSGVHDAVDAEHRFSDAPPSEPDGPTSQKTASLDTPRPGRVFDLRSPRAEPPLAADGGLRGEERRLEQLLAEHLAAVASLVDTKLEALARDLRDRGVRRSDIQRGLRARRDPHVALEPDHPRDGG